MDSNPQLSRAPSLRPQYSSEYIDPAILKVMTEEYGPLFGKGSARYTHSDDYISEETSQRDDRDFHLPDEAALFHELPFALTEFKAIDKFLFFPFLPFDIRELIFKASILPRKVMIYNTPHGPRSANSRPILTPIIPVLFHVNKEARKIATETFIRTTGISRFHPKTPIYFNPALDYFVCFASTTSSIENAASLYFRPLVAIPPALRPLVRRVVMKNNFEYMLGNTGRSLTDIPLSNERLKVMLYHFLTSEFGALRKILLVDWAPEVHAYGRLPVVERVSESVHKEGRWELVTTTRLENPRWRGPNVFRAAMCFA